MTKQTKSHQRLGGSPAGAPISRFRTLTFVATLAAGGAIAGVAQEQSSMATFTPWE